MKVHCCCGYYSNYAERVTGVRRPRDPPFWEAYMFCWAVKSGQYKRDFSIIKSDGRLNITKSNFALVRPTFGEWAAKAVASFGEKSLHLVPVPNTEALANVVNYRTLTMVQEAFRNTEYAGCALDGLRWKKQRQKTHEGGSRKREELLPLLVAKPEVNGKRVVLIDEIVTTGGNLLACADRLNAAGATVVGAVTCGLSVYATNEPLSHKATAKTRWMAFSLTMLSRRGICGNYVLYGYKPARYRPQHDPHRVTEMPSAAALAPGNEEIAGSCRGVTKSYGSGETKVAALCGVDLNAAKC